MAHPKRYTVTAALPYANGPVHLGHVAGAYLPADIYVRYLRQKQATVVFISGSDEHGVPVVIRAQQEGSTPQKVVDQYHTLIKESLDGLGISFDIFARTSSPTHYETATEFFKELHQKDIFEVYATEQYYDPVCEQFLSDRYIKGSCPNPNCNHPDAYGDQCEACGSTLSPEELIDPISVISGAKPILRSTKHWYLPLDKYEGWLKKWILEEHKDFKTNVYGQCKSWLDQGLRPRAVTRDLAWGIPVPLPEGSGKVLYVWFDAPIGYISATKEWAKAQQIDWKPFWKDPATKLVHFLGKDNIVFHCIIFPVMLKAHGKFILPQQVPANEFLNLEGKKISTSRNHAVWLHDYLADFPDKADVLRYVLCTIAPENKDSDFTWQDFQDKNNYELVANLGNLVHRTLSLVHQYFRGLVPPNMAPNEADQSLLTTLMASFTEVGNAIEQFKFKEALQLCMGYATLGNKYLTDRRPWHLVKSNLEEAGTVLHVTLQLIATVTLLIKPFLPTTSEKMAHMLGLKETGWGNLHVTKLVQSGDPLALPILLFEKIEDDVIEVQRKKLQSLSTETVV
ncbi:methionine--tRNA ligase [Cardinium endosymbiont of Oedothorax gibbosus]|uniref:methionine--tRNA ligase n=1 Tax=Cardinium endosymbiont of Oedothorax gibbosus TaxID=931101 RepID=UPI0020243EF2|nr:methionine--tRNA ligase [Cardinium endosymbiont of Oedothorax gibbosus]CAH2559670.1 Methionine--tRNA ligase [Cardinium endosymbiont of Oedothorax gibbosus]